MDKKKEELSFHVTVLKKALNTLEEILKEEYSVIIRDATIQRFEYTFELTWKLFRKAAKIEGIEANSPRQAIRAAYEIGLVTDVDIWFEMLEDRNRTSHTYNNITAEKVYQSARQLPKSLNPILTQINSIFLNSR